MTNPRPEVWLRGPIDGVPAELQPAAHALLQAREEVETLLEYFPDSLLWTRPANVEPVGFHLQHLSGIVDGMLNGMRNNVLTESMPSPPGVSRRDLVAAFGTSVDRAIDRLRATNVRTLTAAALAVQWRAVEDVQRHVGQLLVTVRVQLR